MISFFLNNAKSWILPIKSIDEWIFNLFKYDNIAQFNSSFLNSLIGTNLCSLQYIGSGFNNTEECEPILGRSAGSSTTGFMLS